MAKLRHLYTPMLTKFTSQFSESFAHSLQKLWRPKNWLMTSSKCLYTVKICMLEKVPQGHRINLRFLGRLQNFKRGLQNILRSKNKEFFMILESLANWKFSALFWSVKYSGGHMNPWYQHRSCILTRIWCVPSFKTIELVNLVL